MRNIDRLISLSKPNLPCFVLCVCVYVLVCLCVRVCVDRERGLTPTPACYAVALNALEKEAEWQKAVNLILQVTLLPLPHFKLSSNHIVSFSFFCFIYDIFISLYYLFFKSF